MQEGMRKKRRWEEDEDEDLEPKFEAIAGHAMSVLPPEPVENQSCILSRALKEAAEFKLLQQQRQEEEAACGMAGPNERKKPTRDKRRLSPSDSEEEETEVERKYRLKAAEEKQRLDEEEEEAARLQAQATAEDPSNSQRRMTRWQEVGEGASIELKEGEMGHPPSLSDNRDTNQEWQEEMRGPRLGPDRFEESEDLTDDDREEKEEEGQSVDDPRPSAPPPTDPSTVRRSYDMLQDCRSVDEYERIGRISEGTYGVVYKAREKSTGRLVALKRIKMEKEKDGFPITSIREINVLLNFHHRNIVNVSEIVISYRNPDHIFMVMELMDHDLKSILDQHLGGGGRPTRPFSIAEVKNLMLQLLQGVQYLHSNWVLHRDLKSSNILYNLKGELKICDMGLARQYGSPLRAYTQPVVTLWYRSPELLFATQKYSTAIDIWSVGCIMGELILGQPLFPGQGDFDQLDRIVTILGTPTETQWPGLRSLPNWGKVVLRAANPMLRSKFQTQYGGGASLTEGGFDLLSQLLAWDPAARLTAEEALNHRWFAEQPLPAKQELMPSFAPRKAD